MVPVDYVNESIIPYIIQHYGEFNNNTLEQFICHDFVQLKDKSAFVKVKKQIDKLLEFQNLGYEDIQFLGRGEMFQTLGIGNAVIKIGRVYSPYTQVLTAPFRLNPVYQESLGDIRELYVSQRAKMRPITVQEMQEFYNTVRDNGGIWADIKPDNLGYVDSLIDFSTLYGIPKDPPFGLSFKPYNGHIFLLDYEDLIFLTPEIIQLMLGDSYGCIPNYLSPKISHNLLRENNINSIYSKRFIETPHPSIILMYEANYQESRGNPTLKLKYPFQIKELERSNKQVLYRYAQCQQYGRALKDIRDMCSITEIFERIKQGSCFSKLRNISSTIKELLLKEKSSNQGMPFRNSSTGFFPTEKLSNNDDIEI